MTPAIDLAKQQRADDIAQAIGILDPIERIKRRINDLIESAAAELERERQQAAEAIEAASGAFAIAAAYDQGRRDERGRLRALLEAQQEMLGKAGLNSISLATLSRSLEVES